MLTFADKIEKNAEELATIESTDNGKPIGAAFYDVYGTAEMMKYYAGWIEKIDGDNISVPGYGPF